MNGNRMSIIYISVISLMDKSIRLLRIAIRTEPSAMSKLY